MTQSTPGRVDTLLARAQALVDAVSFDDHGIVVGGQYQGGNGGLLSNETIKAADALRTELLVWKAAARGSVATNSAADPTNGPSDG